MTNWPSTSSLMTRVGSALEPSVGSETVISWFLFHVCTSWTKHKESRRQCGSSPSTRQFKSFHSVDSSGKIIYTLNVYNESCCLQMNIKFKKISHLTAFFVRMINFSSKGNKKPLKCLMKQIVYTVRRNYKIKRKKKKRQQLVPSLGYASGPWWRFPSPGAPCGPCFWGLCFVFSVVHPPLI